MTVDGVEFDAGSARPRHLRAVLLGAGTALAAGALLLLAPAPAQADSGPSGLLGDTLGGVTGLVSDIVSPVVAPLPDVRDVPVAGGIAGSITDSRPIASITTPVTGLVDDLAGGVVGSLPIVGGLVGDRPAGSIVAPVAGAVDDALGGLAGTSGDPAAPAVPPATPSVDAALVPGAHELGLEPALAGVAAVLRTLPAAPLDLVISADGVAPAAVELPAALHGAVAELLPSSAVTSAAAAAGLVGVLGFALLLLLACSRGRPALVRVPPSPVFETDTSPA